MLTLPVAGYFALQNSRVQTFLTQWIAARVSEQINSKISIGRVDISFFKKIILEDVLVESQNRDTLFYTQHLSAKIDTLKFKARKISISQFTFTNSKINIERDSVSHFNFSFLLDSLKTEKDTSVLWLVRCNRFGFHEANISYKDLFAQDQKEYFILDMNVDVSDFSRRKDSVQFRINDFRLNDGKALSLEHLSAGFTFSQNKLHLQQFNLQTQQSGINDSEISVTFSEEGKPLLSDLNYDIRLSSSRISFSEIAGLVPAIKGMDQEVFLSGQVSGNLSDVKGKNLMMKTGQNSSAFFDFSINGMDDWETMFLFVDLKQSKTTFSDISKIKLPGTSKIRQLSFPKALYNTGILSYKGNFTGFLTDFVTYGTFSSRMGILTTDISVTPEASQMVAFRGKVQTTDFQLGKFFQIDEVGKFTFNGNVDGRYNKNRQTINGNFIGYINEMEVSGYAYKNILLDGTLDNKMFDGMLSIDDPNLSFDFSGRVDFNPNIPVFNFDLDLKKARPGQLQWGKHYPESELAFQMAANFKGDRLDNLEGSIVLEDGEYENRNGKLDLSGTELKSVPGRMADSLNFTSPILDIKIYGKYHFQSIINAFEKSASHFLPAIHYKKLANARNNNFNFQIEAKNLDGLTSVFSPGLSVETPFLLYGKFDSEHFDLELEGSIPGFHTKDVWVKNIFIGNKPVNDRYESKFRFGEIVMKNQMSLYNLTVDSKIAGNVLDNQISWSNYHGLTYSGTVNTRSIFSANKITGHPHIEMEGFLSKVFIADSVWEIAPFTAIIDTSSIEINNFSFSNKNQKFAINGKISEDKSQNLSMQLENIDLSHLGTYLGKEIPIKGMVKGSAGIFDFYGQKLVYSDIGVVEFGFRDQQIGDVSLVNHWDNQNSTLNSEISISKNNRKSLNARGTFTPETNELNYVADFDNLSVVILETVLQKNFSNLHGDASGRVRIHGSPDHVLMNGALKGLNTGLTIDYTQVSYNFTDSVYFKGDTIHFDNITIEDIHKNKGKFNGTIVHRNFQNMIYNLSLTTPKIMAINTTFRDNEQFYGQVIASGKLDITGRGKSVYLTGTGTTLPGTSVNISLEYESEIEQYDFIQFVSKQDTGRQEFVFPKATDEDFNLNLTIRATPDARAQLIYNSNIGDVIKAQGEGILLFGMDKDGNITLSGNYTVERGDYLFTMQNVINKRFTIEQGGTIVWSGDPYNAIIDINAVYKLKASLYDFLGNNYDIYQNQRVPVECKILLTEELSNPVINFKVDFPTVEDRIVDEVQQFFNTDEDMNKQILSLLILGKFYTPEYMRGTFEAQNPNLIGSTASELFSNQLSNWLSQISSNIDIGLNYRPGNQITNDEIELALSTQMFNDRVTINGNIGNNVNPTSTNNSNLVGDFDINVKLIPSGKIQLKAYNRSNNNLIYETSPYTQGVGFTFKEEYNTFHELLQKMNAIFRRKRDW